MGALGHSQSDSMFQRSLSARPSTQFGGFEVVERGSMQTDSDLMAGAGGADLLHS